MSRDDAGIAAKIDDLFANWQQGVCPGGQVVVRKGGEIVYENCFGYASVEHRLPITGETVFHVASVSKQITVMCVLLLQEDGLLNVDDDIRSYVPDMVSFAEPVSVRNLMNNVSGIRDQWELLMLQGVRLDDTITQSDAKDVISTQTELNFPPLTRYMYCNSNFTLLAEIAERVSGKSLNEFARERIFAPLGMAQTCFKDRYWQVIPNGADSYKRVGGELIHAVLNYGTYGATSLHTTATDFMKWMANFKEPVICKRETLSEMFACPTLLDGTKIHYAGGLIVNDPALYQGRPFIGHDGSDAAFRSCTVRFPAEDIDIAIFSNTDTVAIGRAAEKIVDLLLGVERSEVEPQVLPDFYDADFADEDVAGTYYSDGTYALIAQVVGKGDQLYLLEEYGAAPLVQVEGNRYQAGTANYELYLGSTAGFRFGTRCIPLKKWQPDQECEADGLAYAGTYESAELGTAYEVLVEDGALYLSHRRNKKQQLLRTAPDQFIAGVGGSLYGVTLTFARAANQAVSGFRVSTGRAQAVAFAKRN